jgi:hypothetical protein
MLRAAAVRPVPVMVRASPDDCTHRWPQSITSVRIARGEWTSPQPFAASTFRVRLCVRRFAGERRLLALLRLDSSPASDGVRTHQRRELLSRADARPQMLTSQGIDANWPPLVPASRGLGRHQAGRWCGAVGRGSPHAARRRLLLFHTADDGTLGRIGWSWRPHAPCVSPRHGSRGGHSVSGALGISGQHRTLEAPRKRCLVLCTRRPHMLEGRGDGCEEESAPGARVDRRRDFRSTSMHERGAVVSSTACPAPSTTFIKSTSLALCRCGATAQLITFLPQPLRGRQGKSPTNGRRYPGFSSSRPGIMRGLDAGVDLSRPLSNTDGACRQEERAREAVRRDGPTQGCTHVHVSAAGCLGLPPRFRRALRGRQPSPPPHARSPARRLGRATVSLIAVGKGVDALSANIRSPAFPTLGDEI